MSLEDRALMSGAELKCPCDTLTGKQKGNKEYSTKKKGSGVLTSVQEFLVSGAELKCKYGTVTCKLKAKKENSTTTIGNDVFASVQATRKVENLDGFGMCLSKECIGGTVTCMARMDTADKWTNPVLLNQILEVQGKEEAIHRRAKLLCVSGRANITALTTGQRELTESEKKFRQYMSEMFGFDREVIEIMLKVIYAIDEEYPNESERKKAWRFASLMGRFSYGYGAEDKFIEIRNELKNRNDAVNYKNLSKEVKLWNITAGEYEDINSEISEKDYFVNKLKLSEYEYYKLRFHVMAQHEITSRPATCFPDFITEGMEIPNTEVRGPIHPYERVWKDYFEKFYSESNFTEEWERLYKKYVNIPNDVYDELKNKYELFADYSKIENKVKEFLEVDLKDYVEDNKIEPKNSDFAHQQILTAAITLEDAVADKFAGESAKIAGMVLDISMSSITADLPILPSSADWMSEEANDIVYSYRTSLAGWLGDLRLADNKMSDDDYKADLDGLNISNLIIKEDINTIEAINEYYGVLESGATTREKEFLCNMGNGDASKGYRNTVLMDVAISTPENAKSMFKQAWDDIKNGEKIELSLDDTVSEFFKKIKVGLE